jgi:hypothetical protein
MATAIANETSVALSGAIPSTSAATEIKRILNAAIPAPAGATFSIGAESGGDAIVVSIQVTDANGNDINARTAVTAFLLADANGDAFNTASATVAAGTDGALATLVTNKAYQCITEADGDLDISITISGAATKYLAIVLPSGKMVISSVITWAA